MDPVPPDVPWSNLVRLLRRLSHNLRNQLNTADLEASLAQNLARDPEVLQSVRNIRRAIKAAADDLQGLLGHLQFSPISVEPLQFAELMTMWRTAVFRLGGSATGIEWYVEASDKLVSVDLATLIPSLVEILQNGLTAERAERPLAVYGKEVAEGVSIQIMEPVRSCPDFASWGRQPFVDARHRHYGVGAWRAQFLIGLNGGTLERRYEAEKSLVVTEITFPRSN